MAFTSIPSADIQVGKPVKQSLMQNIKDNFDALNTSIGSALAALVPNGSFEIDSDSDGIPDNWERYQYSGGTGTYDTSTPAHGEKAYQLSATTSSGGGYLTSDYVPCAENMSVTIRFLHKASVAGMRNIVQVFWYTAAKVPCSTASTTIYDSTANPTSWTAYTRGVAPPSTARFFKIRLYGGYPSATTGVAYFDGIQLSDEQRIDPVSGIAEASSTSDSWANIGSLAITLPMLTSTSMVEIDLIGYLRGTDTDLNGLRFYIGGFYSNEFESSSTTYVGRQFKITVYGLTGAQTLYMQVHGLVDSTGTEYAYVPAGSVTARILRP